MMTFGATFRSLILAGIAVLLAAQTVNAQDPIKVVATFSIVADLTRKIGGEAIELVTLVGPDLDAHGFEPTAADQRAVAGAELLVSNGLGFESWLDRLMEAASFKGRLIVAADGIAARHWEDGDDPENHDQDHGHDHDHFDPHAFQDAQLVLTYIDNIAAGLAEARPALAATFRQNAADLKVVFTAIDADLNAHISALPAGKRRILTSHDAFGYFAHAYGIEFVGLQGMSTEGEPTAQDLKLVIEQIRDGKIGAVFLENMSDPRFVETLAQDTGVKVGGVLYADALSGPDGPAADLPSLFRHNESELLKALK